MVASSESPCWPLSQRCPSRQSGFGSGEPAGHQLAATRSQKSSASHCWVTQALWAGAESGFERRTFQSTLCPWICSGGKHIHVCGSRSPSAENGGGTMSPWSLNMRNTIADDGNFSCIAVVACRNGSYCFGLGQRSFRLKQGTALQAPQAFSGCLAGT